MRQAASLPCLHSQPPGGVGGGRAAGLGRGGGGHGTELSLKPRGQWTSAEAEGRTLSMVPLLPPTVCLFCQPRLSACLAAAPPCQEVAIPPCWELPPWALGHLCGPAAGPITHTLLGVTPGTPAYEHWRGQGNRGGQSLSDASEAPFWGTPTTSLMSASSITPTAKSRPTGQVPSVPGATGRRGRR